MTSIERVLAAIQGKPADRPPVSLPLSLYGARLTNCPLPAYYTDATAYARGQRSVRETIGADILFGPLCLPLEGAAFGSQIRYYDKQPPNLHRPAVAAAEDIARLVVPDIDAHPIPLFFNDAVRLMATEHGREVPIAAIATSPIDLPAMILTLEKWIEMLLFNPQAAEAMLAITLPYFVSRANAFLKAGATFVVTPIALISPRVVTSQIIKKTLLPVLRRAFEQVSGPLVVHSGGAALVPALPWLANFPNVAGFAISAGESLTQARKILNNKSVLIGNLEGQRLDRENVAQIKKKCASTLREQQNDPHFILGTAGGDVPYDTPIENLLAIREAAETYTTQL